MKTLEIAILILITSSMIMFPTIVPQTQMKPQDVFWNRVDSSLRLELKTQSKEHTLASDDGISAILIFDKELDADKIKMAESAGVEFVYRRQSVVHVGRVYSTRITKDVDFQKLLSLGLEKATSGSKQFFPSLTTSVPSTNAPQVWDNLTINESPVTGSGALIAVIDTGATWLHPSFWRPSTNALTILYDGSNYFADLDSDNLIDSDEGPINSVNNQILPDFSYHSDYLFIDVSDDGIFEYDEGDRWLGPLDQDGDGVCSLESEQVVLLGESKVYKIYDQNTGSVYVRGVNLTQATLLSDTNGHGTHVASTAAGGIPDMTSYVGMAPGADLLIIASPLDSASILDGIFFAVENEADIINMSFSSYLGFLDGTDPEDIAITEAFLSDGIISTLAAGNLGGRSKHASFSVDGGSEAGATINVNNPSQYSFLNVIWRSEDDDEHILLTPPSGEAIDLGKFSEVVGNPYALDDDELSAYVFIDGSKKGYNRLIVQISTSDHDWSSGTWTMSLSNPEGAEVFVDAYVWDNSWSGTQLRFTSNVSNERTISSPGTADLGVTVASYNEVTEDLSASSSKGPRIDGAIKPEVAGPGDAINAARNSVSSLWTTRSGTSMAAPHVAGLVALLFQASGDDNQWRILSALLQGSGGIESNYLAPDIEWGWGAVDSVWSVEQLLYPEFKEIYWSGQPVLVEDEILSTIEPNQDIIEIRYHRGLNSISICTEMRGEVDFSHSDDIFIIEANTDNSMATGNNGIDLLLNISDNLSGIYEWDGSSFSVSSLDVDWYNISSRVIVEIAADEALSDWEISIITKNSTVSLADTTDDKFITNQWSPLIESLKTTRDPEGYNITVSISDKDTMVDDFTINIKATDGGGETIKSKSQSGVSNIELRILSSEITTDDLLSLKIEITDNNANLIFPLSPMSASISSIIEILSSTLDTEIVRVGPFISERISGQIVIGGFLLVEDVILSLVSTNGFTLNFTLNGEDGIYDFEISPGNLPLGEYEVVVTAIGPTGEVSSNFASLSIVPDYSYVILIGGIAVVVLAIVVIGMKRYRG